jgi:hypothetical protein
MTAPPCSPAAKPRAFRLRESGVDDMPRKPIGEVAMTATERQRRWRARLSKAAKARRRIQRWHAYAEKNEDAYFTCPEAVICLLHLERPYLPHDLLEPCAGDGAISILLQRAGYDVTSFDIRDHGLPGCQLCDYFKLTPPPEVEGVVTNPPYLKARQFLEKAIADGARYIALLVRTNFLFEGGGRTDLLDVRHPPTRVWTADIRLPMMHRAGWTERRASSNTAYSWAVWISGPTRANSRAGSIGARSARCRNGRAGSETR